MVCTQFADTRRRRDKEERREKGKARMKQYMKTAIFAAPLVALAVHSAMKIRQYGLINAWSKSLARKGSFTASLHHFIAMVKNTILSRKPIDADAKERARKNIWGRYVVRTGEKHDAKGKQKLREGGVPSSYDNASSTAAAPAKKTVGIPVTTANVPVCRFFSSRKGCRQGSACPFKHSAPPPVPTVLPDPPLSLVGPDELTAKLAAALLAQWRSSAPANSYTHAFHRRLAAMNPVCCRSLLQCIEIGGRVKDCFCGGGSVIIEALLLGRDALGVDVSPSAAGIATAQSWLISDEEVGVFNSEVGRIVAELKATEAGAAAVDATQVLDWVAAESAVRRSASVLSETSPRSGVAVALLYIFSFVQHDVFESWRKFRPLSYRFEHTAMRFIAKVLELRRAVPVSTPAPVIRLGDAKVPGSPESIVGVVTSPPYPGVYDYVESDDKLGRCLGDYVSSRDSDSSVKGGVDSVENEIGSKAHLANSGSTEAFQDKWQKDTEAWILAQSVELMTGGRIAMLVGDSAQCSINALASIHSAVAAINDRTATLPWKVEVVASASVAGDVRRPWGKHKRNYRIEHCILIEKKIR
jgi:hypothetical protein